MDLGKKIKRMRNQKGLTQEELADRCELTKGYISQLENDLNSPSIATLTDILSALGSNLSEFFREETEEKIVFSKNEFIEKDSDGVLWNWLIPNAQKNMMEPVLVELSEGVETTGDVPHEGEEFGYVLEGKIAIVRCTRTNGPVNRNGSQNDDAMGTICGGNLSAQKARILLMFALAQNLQNDGIQQIFDQY